MKLVKESLNEYINQAENRAADIEIDRWEAKQRGENPLRIYIKKVINLIMDDLPEGFARHTGLSPEIVDDLITAEEDQILTLNVYDFYNDYADHEVAAMELGEQIFKYVMGQTYD